jgi:(1->4)-alpha-D-glucan 1-alpha-D-glucosylmutase
MTQMDRPVTTYRVQFHQGFRFVDGRDLVPYLSELGVTDLYSSPLYKARRGSSHGYDIENPLRVNSELGTPEEFDEMAEKLRHYSMGVILDTVPNHMAATYENPWWRDVLENGQSSAFAGYFDIDWQPGRVLLPVLGDLYGDVLANGTIILKMEDTGMQARYYEHKLPLDLKSYGTVLRRCAEFPEIEELLRDLESLPGRDDLADGRVLERRREKERIKTRLWQAYQGRPEIKRAVDDALVAVAGSVDEMDALLSQQAYRLAYWKIGYEEINYRRFFDVNELVGIRIESPEVFDNRNRRTLELLRRGKVSGLRIDHIDGLWDPECYLRRLRSESGETYIVVEKILGRDEPLPSSWPVAGTTGYDFLNALNGLFIDPEGLSRIEEIYSRRTGNYLPFAERCYQCNKLAMNTMFHGDMASLRHNLAALAAEHRQARDIRTSELSEALVELTACLPVYRTYIHDFEVSERDRRYILRTLELARSRTSREQVSDAAFAFLRSVLLLETPEYLSQRRCEWLRFVMRWQQISGPIMAKGLEDTATYRHNSLLSLNEVGGDPLRERPPFTLEEFHDFNRRRLAEWPDTMNATATHDTKRGEDVRARLNVLSEMPGEWDRRLELWIGWNLEKKEAVNGVLAPAASEEILIYQTLLGAWPNAAEEEPAFLGRVQEFLVKALREAKQNSSWVSPHEGYESAVLGFVERILGENSRFVEDMRELQKRLAAFGAKNSLAQVLLKIASPGVPDFYQGTEFWQLTLVDPDNRRPVDYKRRIEVLDALRRRLAEDRIGLVKDLAADLQRDEVKMYVTHRALEFRRANRELFARGEYLPLEVKGPCAGHVVTFARKLGPQWAVVVVPRWTTRVHDWRDTEIVMPDGAPREWTDAITGLTASSWRIQELLAEFPLGIWAG